jgi:glycosyltransferase involved in cell wall biosynthesis
MKRISIITAAYNAAKFIKEASDSYLGQELPDGWELEMLIGVDGCPETLKAIMEQELLKDTRLTVFEMDKNYGTYITSNTLITKATGDLIARADADDIMQPTRLLKIIQEFENNPDAIAVNTWCEYRDETLQKITALTKYAPDGVYVYRADTLKELGGFQPWLCGADSELLGRVRMIWPKGLRIIPECLYSIRSHQSQLTVNSLTRSGSDARKYAVEQIALNLIGYRNKTLNPRLTIATGNILRSYRGVVV